MNLTTGTNMPLAVVCTRVYTSYIDNRENQFDFKFNAYSILRWGQPDVLDLATRAISCFQSPTPSRARFRVAIQRNAAGDA